MKLFVTFLVIFSVLKINNYKGTQYKTLGREMEQVIHRKIHMTSNQWIEVQCLSRPGSMN